MPDTWPGGMWLSRLKAAVDFIDRVEDICDQLALFPDSGSHIPEFPDTLYRQVFARPYRLFHRVEDETVWITALYHDRKQPTEPELRELAYFTSIKR